jgi:hypothetical protein
MNPNIKIKSNELKRESDSMSYIIESNFKDLNKKLLEVTSKLINNNFKNNDDKIEAIKQQAYFTGKLEEITRQKERMNNIDSKIKELDILIEYQTKEDDKKKEK